MEGEEGFFRRSVVKNGSSVSDADVTFGVGLYTFLASARTRVFASVLAGSYATGNSSISRRQVCAELEENKSNGSYTKRSDLKS
jgi:hypothetical protein